ncbi:MAG TPA: prepilin-type N-terminal cleavage/methylation domain-containing protein [Fibrobacteria bacterium]|nr:prepilin-type N-terminal cleavage/methylation domain-containing protein [Fibrobacteria bacterium]
MFPSDSEAEGFTLIEVLITMVVAVILGVATVRFYRDSYRTYSLQEQIADRNQNAHFTLNKLVELIQQAGTALPDTGWTVLSVSSGILTVGINPRGAEQFNGADAALSSFVPVSDASQFANTGNGFLNTTHVLIDYADPLVATRKVAIDVAYNTKGFVNGVKNNPAGMDSLRLAAAVTLSEGDRIFGYREDQYLLVGSDLVIRPNGVATKQMVLAQDIDMISCTFLNEAGSVTTNWKNMRSASIIVRARTEKPDPRLPAPGYHLISLPMNVILRNKV